MMLFAERRAGDQVYLGPTLDADQAGGGPLRRRLLRDLGDHALLN